MQDNIIHAIMMGAYLFVMIAIGLFFFKKSKSQNDYILGGRSLNLFVTSLSAQASDMSGWLLMGLPGTAFLLTYKNGLVEATWTAIGLALGTYLNWLLIARRLRKYSEAAGDSITLPTYIENRFKAKNHLIRILSAIFIVIFFTIYTASGFSAGAKLFEAVFGIHYSTSLIVGALIIVAYTFLGGFLAVCWTDLIQGILMFAALIVLPLLALFNMGAAETFDIAAALAGNNGFTLNDWFGFGTVGALSIISFAAWGLGYFGQPHILARFMGIRKPEHIKPARRIAILWVVISLFAAVFLGVVGKVYLSMAMTADNFSNIDPERVFILLVQNMLQGPFAAFLAGILLTAILAAIMSTADSQLLVTSSAVSEDISKIVFKLRNRPAKDGTLLWISRLTVIAVTIIGVVIASDPSSSVFDLVSYAWAGFGAAFGPVILISLYWKRMNWKGALAGILSGGLTVMIWKNFIKAHINIYEIVPAFLISVICIIIFSLITKKPDKSITDEFESVSK